MATRRTFLIGAGVGLFAAAGGGGFLFRTKLGALRRGVRVHGLPDVAARPGKPLPAAAGKSRIVQVHHGRVLTDRGQPEPRAVQELLDKALRRAYDVEHAGDAWKALFPDPSEVVGIKVNVIAGKGGPSTSPELVRAIIHGLTRAGIAADNILVFDRAQHELEGAGFTMNPDGPGPRVLSWNLLFRGYQFSDPPLPVNGTPVRLAHAVRLCSSIINCVVPKHHGMAGYTGALKSWYGVIENARRFHEKIHERETIPAIAALPPIRSRVRLTIAEALRSQSERGPHSAREWQFTPRLLMVGTDPVALDVLGARVIEEERRRRGLKSLAESDREPRYFALAAKLGLGTADPAAIEHLTDEV
ncbi:MAG TPA: DUF362 domain-containing protein [Polyangia bacterium]|jgi:hypothetical protein